MLSWLRPTLTCHYCGTKSSHKPGIVRSFKCASCEAENHFDEHGNITDPPAPSAPEETTRLRYAHAPAARARSPSPPPSPTPAELDNIFCQTCLNNQIVVQEALSGYLPAEDHPQYDQYVASQAEYREKLEERYPQICSKCAPRARERIKQTAYLAKTDHLRRMMDRSRHFSHDRSGGRILMSFVIRLAGVGFVGSTLLQALWHALTAMSITPMASSRAAHVESISIESASVTTMFSSCLLQTYSHQAMDHRCSVVLENWISLLLLITIITAWWNPQLSRRDIRNGEHLTHRKEYYTLQIILILLRIAAPRLLGLSASTWPQDALKGAHLFMALLLLSSLFLSLRIIKVDRKSTVSFQLSDNAVLPNVAPAKNAAIQPFNQDRRTNSHQPFPIDLLYNTPTAATPLTRKVMSLPPTMFSQENDDPDAMDWTPTSKSSLTAFSPPARTTGSSFGSTAQTGPSPFHGTLPPAPIPPAHRLRKPPTNTPGAFKKASDMQKNQFSMNLRSSALPDPITPIRHHRSASAYDTDATVTDDEDGTERRTTSRCTRNNMSLAAPKFWAQQDVERKTGLEDIFEEGFSIKDTPNVVVQRGRRGQPNFIEGVSDAASGSPRNKERWGGFGDRPDDGQTAGEGATTTTGLSNMLAIGMIPVVCLGIAIVVVKGGYL